MLPLHHGARRLSGFSVSMHEDDPIRVPRTRIELVCHAFRGLVVPMTRDLDSIVPACPREVMNLLSPDTTRAWSAGRESNPTPSPASPLRGITPRVLPGPVLQLHLPLVPGGGVEPPIDRPWSYRASIPFRAWCRWEVTSFLIYQRPSMAQVCQNHRQVFTWGPSPAVREES